MFDYQVNQSTVANFQQVLSPEQAQIISNQASVVP